MSVADILSFVLDKEKSNFFIDASSNLGKLKDVWWWVDHVSRWVELIINKFGDGVSAEDICLVINDVLVTFAREFKVNNTLTLDQENTINYLLSEESNSAIFEAAVDAINTLMTIKSTSSMFSCCTKEKKRKVDKGKVLQRLKTRAPM